VRYAFASMTVAPESKRRQTIQNFLAGNTPQQLILLLENGVEAM
jgi:hypothetical protein